MIKYVATLKIKGVGISKTIEAEAYKSDYMSDYDLEEAERELKNDLKKTYGDDIEIVSYHIGVCENEYKNKDNSKA